MRKALILVLFLMVGVGVTADRGFAQLPWPAEDHFKVYQTTPPVTYSGFVDMEDQFGLVGIQGMILDHFATPVIKNGEQFYDLRRHQTWWNIDIPQLIRQVDIENQFGLQRWLLGDARFAVLPAFKNDPTAVEPPIANHYLCYDALQGPPINIPVLLEDQFDTLNVLVYSPVVFCNPAQKTTVDGTVYPIIDPEAHLACYRIDPKQYDLTVFALDQFGQWQFQVVNQEWLCVPSYKTNVTPTERDTWGGIKTRYR